MARTALRMLGILIVVVSVILRNGPVAAGNDAAFASVLAPAADRTVGPGCTYATITAAVTAASPGDRLRLAGNVTFAEHVVITKDLILEGGYNGCTSASSARTTINGSNTGIVLTITRGTVALSNLIITNGKSTMGGGGIRFGDAAAGVLTLTDVELHHNTAAWGGAISIGANSVLTGTGLNIHDNSATSYGGGVNLTGAQATLTGSNIHHNSAPYGGGIYAGGGSGSVPDANIQNTFLRYNTASTDGGAVYITSGTLDFTGWWDLRWNIANGNGGALAIIGTADADFRADGGPSYLGVNSAGGNGGAIYLTNADTVEMWAVYGYMVSFNTNTAGGSGGGGYADAGGFFDVYGNLQMTSNQADVSGGLFYLAGGSRVWFSALGNARPQIMVNSAANGGAVFAIGGYMVDCDDAVFGTGVNGNKATGGNGGAIYLISTPLFADNCTFQNNQATGSGGAIFAFNSEVNVKATFTASDAPRVGAGGPADVQAFGCDPAGRCSSFHDNLADSDANDSGNGAAIYLSGGSLTMSFTHLYRNKAFRGGAIYQTGSAATTLENSLITANQATDILGGGIYSDNGTLSVTHVTIANNLGVGFFSGSAGSLATNSIAWGNTNGGFFNNFSASSSCNIDQSGYVGTNTNPQFIGGGSYLLSKSSPAINACTLGLGKDLNNRARPIGPKFDMGAYEGGYVGVFLPMVRK